MVELSEFNKNSTKIQQNFNNMLTKKNFVSTQKKLPNGSLALISKTHGQESGANIMQRSLQLLKLCFIELGWLAVHQVAVKPLVEPR